MTCCYYVYFTDKEIEANKVTTWEVTEPGVKSQKASFRGCTLIDLAYCKSHLVHSTCIVSMYRNRCF